MIVTTSVACAVLALVVVGLTRHLAVQQPIAVTAEWLDQISTETDELLRLVGEEAVPVRPRSTSGWTVEVCLIHDHLPRLKNDFKLISHAVKAIILQSDRDRPDLARALVRSQVIFAYRVMTLQYQLARGRLRRPAPSRP
jgi:hypothetical protein